MKPLNRGKIPRNGGTSYITDSKGNIIRKDHLFCPCCNKVGFAELCRIQRRNSRHYAKSQIRRDLEEFYSSKELDIKEYAEELTAIESDIKMMREYQLAKQAQQEIWEMFYDSYIDEMDFEDSYNQEYMVNYNGQY